MLRAKYVHFIVTYSENIQLTFYGQNRTRFHREIYEMVTLKIDLSAPNHFWLATDVA